MSTPDQRPDLAFAREKARRTFPVTLLVLLGIIAMYLPLPKRFVAVVPLALAAVLTIRLLRFLALRRGREKVWPAVTLGIVGLMLSTLAVQAVFYDDVSAYEQCIESAQTQQARGACEQLREDSSFGARFLLQ
ncbi:hypothetical protein [Intrasporangium sp. DVR]|uniref:hypothetical protein n=1 Tax=Intrasporangium sp. DVR TaxID=3127867 RepID=UPI00313A7384